MKGFENIKKVVKYSLDLNIYRQIIGYVSQETILFNTSIKDNILWANPNLTDSELYNICKKT